MSLTCLKKSLKFPKKAHFFFVFLDEKQKTLIKQHISRDLVLFFKIVINLNMQLNNKTIISYLFLAEVKK